MGFYLGEVLIKDARIIGMCEDLDLIPGSTIKDTQ